MAKGIMYIDGQRVPFDGEKNVLAVIRKAGIDMPTFCYYSELSTFGACRMCVVEDEKGARTEYRITGSQEANPMEHKLSDDSPFGRAIVGKAAGETFTVNAPAGSFSMKVVSVSREG